MQLQQFFVNSLQYFDSPPTHLNTMQKCYLFIIAEKINNYFKHTCIDWWPVYKVNVKTRNETHWIRNQLGHAHCIHFFSL